MMDQIIYLDNGATSFPKPEEVYLYMDYFYMRLLYEWYLILIFPIALQM